MLELLTQFLIPIFLITTIIIGVLIEIEESGKATSLFFVVAFIFGFIHFNELVQFIITHPKEIVIGSVIYVLLGIFWSIFKWTVYVKDTLHKFERYKKALEKDEYYKGNEKLIFEKLSEKFSPCIYNKYENYEQLIEKLIPEASKKKSLIISWIAYFPISILSTILNNPLRRFFEWVYESVSGIYDKITSSSKKKVLDRIK